MSRSHITQASVHPLVLLSIVDHFNRVNVKQRNKRVVGALLGTFDLIQGTSMTKMWRSSTVMPFPSRKIPVSPVSGSSITSTTNRCSIWWRKYHLSHADQSKREVHRLVHHWRLFQSSRRSDKWGFQEVYRPPHLPRGWRRTQRIDVTIQNELGLPTQIFITQDEINAKTGSVYKSFFHIESKVEATEPEEIGVEHLLREIK